MINKTIPYEKIQKIARSITKGYLPKELPSLEKVSWAFPIEGRDRVYYHKGGYLDRIPNTQEGNAMRQLMTFKNFKNVLSYLKDGKTIIGGNIPNHTLPCGDAEDGAYMICPYMKQEDLEKGGITQNGFFWETLPSGIVKEIFKVERTGRGKLVNANGEEIEKLGNNAYVDENLTRQYVQSLRNAYDMGTEHLLTIANSSYLADNYPQLVLDRNPKNWKKGTKFQKGFYMDGAPGLLTGRVLENDGKRIKSKVWGIEQEEKSIIHNDKISDIKKYGEHGLLWRLVSAKK